MSKELFIPYINVETENINHLAEILQKLQPTKIDVVNWANKFPAKPDVELRTAHDNETLFLQYTVHESEILAKITEDNGKVWTDSCVEMFISFDDEHYYNAEFSCIGKALLGYRPFGGYAEHASMETLQLIERLSSLGKENFDLKKGDFKWTLTLAIPKEVFWKSDIASFAQLKVRGNFYKCGDNLETPHFVSWTSINVPDPSFHQPKYFGEIEFE